MKPRQYHFELICPRCGKVSETVTDSNQPLPHVNCGDCLMDAVEVVEFKIVRVSITCLLTLALLFGTDAKAQQRTVYGADGKVQSRVLTDSQGSTTIYDAAGRVQGRTSTTSNGTTVLYGSDGKRVGTVTPPTKN